MKALCIAAGLALTLALPVVGTEQAAAAVNYKGTVVSIVDGDTIKVDIKDKVRTVRLIGVDVNVDCGRLAERYVKAQLEKGDTVRLRIDKKHDESDHRLFAYVYERGTFVNLELIRRGTAIVRTYGKYGAEQQYKSRFLKAERDARKNDRGYWDDGKFDC